MTIIQDGLQNVMTGMGDPMRDKIAGISYATAKEYSRKYWSDFVRGSGLARRIVSTPADDATREGREWKATDGEISKIEALENDLATMDAIKCALEDRSTFGRGFVYIDNGEDPIEPLDPARGGLRFVRYIAEADVGDGPIQTDPMAADYGFPEYYYVMTNSAGLQNIHPTRLLKFYGDRVMGSGSLTCKHDPIVRRSHEAILKHDATRHAISNLVQEAKVDIWTIPHLMQILSNPESEAAFIKAQQTANMLKGVHGTVFQDAGSPEIATKYDRKTQSFATLPDVASGFEDYVCATAGFPKAYLFVRSGAGLGDNGASELELAYGRIGQMQKTVIDPALKIYNELLIHTALGSRPADAYYEWRSLWSMSDKDRADIGKTVAETFKIITETEALPLDVVSGALINTMTERGGVALEGEYAEWLEGGRGSDDAEDASVMDAYVPYIAPVVVEDDDECDDEKPDSEENAEVVQMLKDHFGENVSLFADYLVAASE